MGMVNDNSPYRLTVLYADDDAVCQCNGKDLAWSLDGIWKLVCVCGREREGSQVHSGVKAKGRSSGWTGRTLGLPEWELR